MAETFDVYEPNGAQIGAVPISPRDLSVLHNGGTITVTFHTPRMLRQVLDIMNGSFDLIEVDGKIVTTQPETVKRYIEMQADIAKAMKDKNKWSDPDAESDAPVR
jgi:hypothetical protein